MLDHTSSDFFLYPPQEHLLNFGLVTFVIFCGSVFFAFFAQWFAEFWPPITTDKEFIKKHNNPISIPNVAKLVYVFHLSSSIMCAYFFALAEKNNNLKSFPDFSAGFVSKFVYFAESLLWFFVLVLQYDLFTYIFHRFGHENSFVWRHSHHIHHENRFPAAVLDNMYVEFLEYNIIALFCLWPIFVLPLTYISLGAYLFFAPFAVGLNHSGRKIEIPYVYSIRYHLAHHMLLKYNYAEHLPLWDWLFGTFKLPSYAEMNISSN